MQSLKGLLTEYQTQHQNHHNAITHAIGIPAVVIGTLLLFSWISISIATHWHITFAWLAIALALIYYYRQNVKLAAAMTVVLVILTLLCSWIAYPKPSTFSASLFIILFFGGWILLLIGHAIEKTKPAFSASLMQLLIGPLFLVITLLVKFNLGKYFDLDELTSDDKKEHP